MNARVFLLVLGTAAFMAVWDADRPAKSQVAAIHEKSSTVAEAALQRTNGLIPLPNDLQSGIWHVFNHDGDTFRITVEHRSSKRSQPSRVASIEPDIEKRICVLTGADGIRWCFIEQQPRTAQQVESVTR